MQKPVADVRSETAYDALQDGLGVVLRLLAGPRTVAELVAETHLPVAEVEAQLGRLVKAGLARRDGDRYEAMARMVHQTRQEGVVTFLSRYFLPSITGAAREQIDGYWEQLDLDLAPAEQEALRGGRVQALIEELNGMSDEAATERVACTAVVIGTSDVPKNADAGDRLLETVRRTSRQRATPADASRAIGTQFDALFGTQVVPRAEAAVRRAAGDLRRRASDRPTYTVVLGFFPREAKRAVGGEDVGA